MLLQDKTAVLCVSLLMFVAWRGWVGVGGGPPVAGLMSRIYPLNTGLVLLAPNSVGKSRVSHSPHKHCSDSLS